MKNKKFKAVVIGIGNIGMMYDFDSLRPHPSSHVMGYCENDVFELTGVVESDSSKETLLRKFSKDTLFFKTLEEAFTKEAFVSADVISICTPPDTHFEILKFLADRDIGSIYFCEKPLVNSTEEARELKNLMTGKRQVIIPNITRRWNTGLRKIIDMIRSEQFGKLLKIHVRYTRGIFNTGSHMFDLIHMWTGDRIRRVKVLSETPTSAVPERSFSFYFELGNNVSGFAEAMDDRNYYLFEYDLFFSDGKIEVRDCGDTVIYYKTDHHHLYSEFRELKPIDQISGLLSDSGMRNAIANIERSLQKTDEPYCALEDAICPLYIAEALEKSYITHEMEELTYE